MKKILFLVTVASCLATLSAAPAPLPPACGAPSFKAARSHLAGSAINLDGVVVADLNNDGRPDVVTANSQSSTVSVLLGDGQSFSPSVSVPVGPSETARRPTAIATADFNKDGKADVVTSNDITDNLSVMLGDGAGGFSSTTLVNGLADPQQVATGDFNGDGNTDLAAASLTTLSVKVALGDGAGGFGPLSSFGVNIGPRGVAAADFNLDGKTDLAVVTGGVQGLSVLLGDGAGGFAPQMTFNVGVNPRQLAVADFNGDGKPDLVSANSGSNDASVLFGSGDGRFQFSHGLLAGSPVNSVAVGDFNNDGAADVATGSNAAGVNVYLNVNGNVSGTAKNFPVAVGPLYLAAADFNLDGSEDVIAASGQAGTVVPLAGDGAGNLATTPRVTAGSNVSSAALADFNGDGKLDAVLSHDNANNVTLRLGNGFGSFTPSVFTFSVGTRPWWIATGDFNNDNKADFVTANFLGANLTVRLGDGGGGFGPASSLPLGNFNPSFVAVADVNSDNKADILAIRDNVSAVSVLLGDGAGGFAAPAHFATAPNPRAVAVGDFNADGKPDLAVSDNHVTVLLGDGAGSFGAPINTHFGDNTGPRGIVAADFNADGKSDVALVNEFTHNLSVLVGDGTGHFAPRVNYKVGRGPTTLVTADFNGDGLHDLAAGNNSSESVSVLLGDGAGGFGLAYDWAIPANPNAVAVGDLNADGKTDLVAAGGTTLASLVNTCGQAAPTPDVLLSVNDVTVAEPDAGTVNAVFTVSLSAASAQQVTVKYVLGGAGAQRGLDFQAASGTLTFEPGVTTQTVAVAVNGDTTDEFDESFTLNLFEPVNALIADRSGSATITDNDAPPAVSVGNASAAEGQTNGTLGFTVTLSQASGKLVSVAYSTGGGTASAGSDYVSGAGTLSIPAGATSGTINVQVIGDTANEPDETFFVSLSSPFNATLANAQGLGTILNDDMSKVQFGGATFSAAEGGGVNVTVTRTGDSTLEAFVSYATSDGTANARQDYTAALGRLRFGPGENSKTFRVLATDDRFNDDGESFNVTLSNPSGAELGAQTSATVNIDDNDSADGPSPVGDAGFSTDFFVRQHYADFLSREPDAEGLAFWKGEIDGCGADAQCREVKRINVSAAFFLSIEFQETGYLAYRAYKAAYGDATSPNVAGTVPVIRLSEFLADAQRIGAGVQVNVGEWQQQLEANKNAYALEFVQRPRFTTAYPSSLTPTEFVDKLNQNAGGALDATERASLINELAADNTNAGRASVLRKVAEDADLRNNEKNRAFVLMQYFGYLRRNPDDAPEPNLNYAGWRFWLDKLNEFGGNFVQAEMVKAFISSDEYRNRFGL